MTASVPNAAPDPGAFSFAARVRGALLLDGHAFEAVENDPSAARQALLVVLLAGLARGVGALRDEGLVGLLGSPVVALAVWLVAAVLVWGIGVKRFGYTSSYLELLRTLGFAAAPLLLLAACAFPLGALLPWTWAVLHAWSVLALIVAVREALDVPLQQALVVCGLALGVTLAILFLFGLLLVGDGIAG